MEKKQPEKERTEESARLLERLSAKMRSSNPSVARNAAFNLSWLQEDGFEILKNALFGDETRRTKSAAAYGLRKMQGRMKKLAHDLFEEGLGGPDQDTQHICENALRVIHQGSKGKAAPTKRKPKPPAQVPIREIPAKRTPRTVRALMDEARQTR